MIIIAYGVIEATSPRQLADSVTRLIQEGWQPWGSVAAVVKVDRETEKTKLLQAVVFYGEAQDAGKILQIEP